MVNEKSTLKELEQQAKNTKLYVDRLVKANTGFVPNAAYSIRKEKNESEAEQMAANRKSDRGNPACN